MNKEKIVELTQDMTEQQKMLFMMALNGRRKSKGTAYLLAVLLGGAGAHRFYLGKIGRGFVVMLMNLFCWVMIFSAYAVGGQAKDLSFVF
jgi:TM2 domain-containing membrane protein YozV